MSAVEDINILHAKVEELGAQSRDTLHLALVAAWSAGRLLAEEKRHPNPETAILASTQMLNDLLAANGMDYSEFVFSLSSSTCLESSI